MRNQIIEEDLMRITAQDLPWSIFDGKTVLITGANGFLPAYMVEVLICLNDIKQKSGRNSTNVIGLVRNQSKANSRFSFYQGRDDLHFIEQDVCTPISIDEPIDYIIHAASQASPKYYKVDPYGTLSANVIGTNNLIKLARRNKVRGFMFISSSEVYGQLEPTQGSLKETDYGWLDPTDLRSCYAESKRMGETMCISSMHQYGLPVKIVRPFHTYGPGMKLDDGRVFSDFVADVLENRNIIMRSDGSATRAFCYIADATIGFFTVLLMGDVGEAYNIGNDQGEISILNLARMLVTLNPEKKLKVIFREENSHPGYIKSAISKICPDITKARALGWQPTTSIRVGFSRTIRSYNEFN